jgi:predicted nucleic acid-binding protein
MNGVIFDTSIWIEYFKANPIFFDRCQDLIEKRLVLTLDLIFAELVQGAKGQREIVVLKEYYQQIPKIDQPDLVFTAGIFSQENKLINQGIGLIDAIILVAGIKNQYKIWTLDKKILRFLESYYPSYSFHNS